MLVHSSSVGTMATIGMLLCSLTTHAADQMVLGSQFVVKNPGTPDKRRVIAKAREIGTDDVLVGDPVANGATLRVNATGATSSNQTFDLPTGTSVATGRPFWAGDALMGFTYKDPKGENGPVKSMQIKRRGTVFQMKVAISGKLGSLAIVPPNPGIGGCVFFRITNADSYSVSFATGNGQVTSSATFFKVAKPQTEGSCLSTTLTFPSTSSTTSSTSTTLPIPCGDTTYPTCGGMCPDAFACEGISYRANLDQLPGCGGVGCSNQATTSCECVPSGSVCGGSCSSDICSFDIVFDHGECGAGKHCAMDVDYFCVLPQLSCPVGCVDD